MVTIRWAAGRLAILVAALLVVAVAQQDEGVAIWSNRGNSPPGYALWEGDRYSASKSMENTGGRWRIIQGAFSPTRDEAIVLGVTEDEEVTGQIYNGVGWSELPFSPLDSKASNSYWSGFEVRYESKSGNALVVWHEGKKDTVLYRTWDGSSWSSESQISVPVKGGEHSLLQLEASPISNEMVLIVGVRSGSDYCIVWDGNNWGNGLELGTGDNGDLSNVNVAYEQRSGRALIVYTKKSPTLSYRTWDGQRWSGEGSVTPPVGITNRIKRVVIGADPSSNRIVVGVTSNSDLAFWLAVWDGSNDWGSLITAASGSPAESFHGLAVAFEGNSGKALATYVQSGNEVRYRIWSKTWSGEYQGPNLFDGSNSMLLATLPGSNKVMLSVQDNGQGANFCVWDGNNWGTVNQMTSDTGEFLNKNLPFLFIWKPVPKTNPPTPAPTLKLTPFPSLRPTPAPSQSPTPRPTKDPSNPPTRPPTPTPTAQPTPVSTPQPTLPPTPHPTIAPTMEPTAKPTNHPTIAPTAQPTLLPTTNPTSAPTMPPTLMSTNSPTTSPTPIPSLRPSKDVGWDAASTGSIGTGKSCSRNLDCKSKTCRNGACMASPECYPVKHKYGKPFNVNAINIVFVGSSFDTATHDVWRAQVNTTYEHFRNYNMFSDDIDQFNIFIVDTVELSESFCQFGCVGVDRLLCCDVQKAETLSSKCFPVGANLQTVVIHNDDKYGGAGYTAQNIATMSTHKDGPLVAIHELGHSLFELADEYSYGPGNKKDPNCAATSDCFKWSDLVENTPEGYEQVSCEPGCRNGNFFVGKESYMGELKAPVGAVNERYTCCTYQALTKSMPSYCNVFDFSPNYLFNFCKNKDFQKYGASNYDVGTALKIKAPSFQDNVSPSGNVNYVHVTDPMLVKIRLRKSGKAVIRDDPIPLPSGMYHKTQVVGDFARTKDAAKMGLDSYVKVKVVYRGGKQMLFFSQDTKIEVPLLSDTTKEDDAPRSVSQKSNVIEMILDTKGRKIRKVRASLVETQNGSIPTL